MSFDGLQPHSGCQTHRGPLLRASVGSYVPITPGRGVGRCSSSSTGGEEPTAGAGLGAAPPPQSSVAARGPVPFTRNSSPAVRYISPLPGSHGQPLVVRQISRPRGSQSFQPQGTAVVRSLSVAALPANASTPARPAASSTSAVADTGTAAAPVSLSLAARTRMSSSSITRQCEASSSAPQALPPNTGAAWPQALHMQQGQQTLPARLLSQPTGPSQGQQTANYGCPSPRIRVGSTFQTTPQNLVRHVASMAPPPISGARQTSASYIPPNAVPMSRNFLQQQQQQHEPHQHQQQHQQPQHQQHQQQVLHSHHLQHRQNGQQQPVRPSHPNFTAGNQPKTLLAGMRRETSYGPDGLEVVPQPRKPSVPQQCSAQADDSGDEGWFNGTVHL